MEMTEVVSTPRSSTQALIRLLDLVLACLMLLLLNPVLLGTALLVRINLGSPVFIRQLRGGRHNRSFRIIKFRSMRDGVDADGRVLADHERLTPFGRFLHKSSLDELPERLNVLIGDMSRAGLQNPLHSCHFIRCIIRSARKSLYYPRFRLSTHE